MPRQHQFDWPERCIYCGLDRRDIENSGDSACYGRRKWARFYRFRWWPRVRRSAIVDAMNDMMNVKIGEMIHGFSARKVIVDGPFIKTVRVPYEEFWTMAGPIKILPLAAKTVAHKSDCAINNGPAYLPGPCNCGAEDANDRSPS